MSTQAWSPEMETAYQAWVQSSWTKNVFNESGPLQGVKLDCADAVYSMRMLFSYENGLPFAAKDPSANRIITNDINRFNSIQDPQKRFRAFALYIYDLLGTETLAEDSYPVAINKASIHSGVFLKTAKASHHSWSVHDIDATGIPHLLFASRPARTTLFERHGYPTMGFLWGEQDSQGNQISAHLQTPGDPASGVGFRMFRYAQDLLKPVWQVPGYSLDQYQMKQIGWARVIQKQLQLKQETSEQQVERLLTESCQEVQDRIGSVNDAIRAMKNHSPSYCFSSEEYDDYSTPSRDSRTVGVFRELLNAYTTSGNGEALSAPTRARIEAIVYDRDPGTFCPVKVSAELRLTLGDVVKRGVADLLSSNPNDSLLARWGGEKSPTLHAASCPTY